MMRRLTAIVLSALMLLSLLTGCAKKPSKAEEFYTLADEIKGIQDAKVNLTMPYHGAVLRVEGFVSKTDQSADLTFSLEGTEHDGTWTRLIVSENQIWLDVGQMAAFTAAFPLSENRSQEIRDLADNQAQSWLTYLVEGELWSGIPGWKELLSTVWQDSKADLSDCITADGENAYLLKLEGKSLEQKGGAVAQRLRDHCGDYQTGFEEFWDQQITLKYAVPRSAQEMFAELWQRFLHEELPLAQEENLVNLDDPAAEAVTQAQSDTQSVEQEPIKAVELRLSQEGSDYGVVLRHNHKEVFNLTLTPATDLEVEEPQDSMGLEDYFNDFYYLISFSRDYVNAVLDGTQEAEEEDPHGHDQGEPVTEETLMPMTTTPAEGYDGIALITYQTAGGGVMQVPVLTGYNESTVDSENMEGNLVLQAYLYAGQWSQEIHTLAAAGSPAEDAQQEMQEYFDLYVGASGNQVIEDRSEVAVNADGTVAACGFSSQENPYTSIMARLIIVMRQKDASSNTVLDLHLDLDQMTDSQRAQVESLCAYLGVDVPISLKIE